MTSHGNGSETPTQWKSESVTSGQTYQLTGVGARDAYAFNKLAKLGDAIAISNLKLLITNPIRGEFGKRPDFFRI